MKKLIEEFKTFIMRGNVLDMAVGVIVATAFGKITSSLINDVIMPFVGWVCGTRDMTALNVLVRAEEVNEAGEVVREAITLGFGNFIAAVVDFLLVSLVVFAIVKAFNTAHELTKKKAAAEAEAEADETPAGPSTEELLTEILAELRKK